MRKLALLLLLFVALAVVATRLLLRSEPLPKDARIDRIVVKKRDHSMTAFEEGKALKTYRVALGRGGQAAKERAGDNRVPEGEYSIASKNERSTYHRALRVSYPTPLQSATAHSLGYDPGGDIMIHGIRNGLGWLGPLHRYVDWTKGCIAVTDDEIEELMRSVPAGTRVSIEP